MKNNYLSNRIVDVACCLLPVACCLLPVEYDPNRIANGDQSQHIPTSEEMKTILEEHYKLDSELKQVDRYLSDYYSGVIDMQIKLRKIEFQTPETVDENIGGGTAQNKENRVLDNQLIIEESDYALQSFIRDKWCMSNFLKILTEEERAMLSLRYNRRRKHSWNQVARILSKSESQCHRDLQKIKQIYRKSVFAYQLVDNSKWQKHASF